jgi:hypothetical protein
MNINKGLQCLRPYLVTDLPVAKKLVYLRFYNTTRRLAVQVASNGGTKRGPQEASAANSQSPSNDKSAMELRGPGHVEQRMKELRAANALVYPRIQRHSDSLSCVEYLRRYGSLKPGETLPGEAVTIRGTVQRS